MSPETPCLFCAIGKGSIPATIVHETPDLLAFLDVRPIRPGHVLIIPRKHYPYFDDLPADLATGILQSGQVLARAMKAHYGCERVGFVFTGTDIDHAHAHVVPLFSAKDITSIQYMEQKDVTFRPAPQSSREELAKEAAALRAALAQGAG